MTAQEIIRAYLDTLASDGEKLAAMVTDDVTFEGPFFQTTGAKAFVEGMQQWIRVQKQYGRIEKQFIAGNDICSIYTVNAVSPVTGETVSMPVADLIELRAGKIAKERVYFDPRDWARATAGRPRAAMREV